MSQPDQVARELAPFWLWFGFLGAPAAWFAHLTLVYILVPLTCATGGRGLMYLVTVLMGGIAVAAGAVAWRHWRAMRQVDRDQLIGNMEGTRTSFMIVGGIVGSGLFILGILLATIPVLYVDPCLPTPAI